MAALVAEGLKHRRKHQPIGKDSTKPSSIETRLEYNSVSYHYPNVCYYVQCGDSGQISEIQGVPTY